MTPSQILIAVAARAAHTDGLKIYEAQPRDHQLGPPCAWPAIPRLVYNDTGDPTEYVTTIMFTVVVPRQDQIRATHALADFLAPTGPGSIIAALQTQPAQDDGIADITATEARNIGLGFLKSAHDKAEYLTATVQARVLI